MPDPLQHIAKYLIIGGIILAAIGVLLFFAGKSGIPFGSLPGDIAIKRKNFSFYFPITTSIILSIILSLIFYFLSKK